MYSEREIAQRTTLKERRQWIPLFTPKRPSILKPSEVYACLKYCVDKPGLHSRHSIKFKPF
jgi:hypothetical protein